jgi:hypothetical protein
VFEIYKTFPTLSNADDNYADTKKELSDYFQPQNNAEFLRFAFGNVTQQDKSIDEYVTQLRQKANINLTRQFNQYQPIISSQTDITQQPNN